MRLLPVFCLVGFASVLGCGDGDGESDAAVLDGGSDAMNADSALSDSALIDAVADSSADASLDAPADGSGDVDAFVDAGSDTGVSDAGDDAAFDAGPGVNMPACRFQGTRSEGWYSPDGARICWTFCDGSSATCEFVGTRSEGWYASSEPQGCEGARIEYARCSL